MSCPKKNRYNYSRTYNDSNYIDYSRTYNDSNYIDYSRAYSRTYSRTYKSCQDLYEEMCKKQLQERNVAYLRALLAPTPVYYPVRPYVSHSRKWVKK